tara:strand:- start:481 stop:729 length:249 start_codon:yes stop_codon:yes gene_type:complete
MSGKRRSVWIKDGNIEVLDRLYPGLGLGTQISRYMEDYPALITKVNTHPTMVNHQTNNDDVERMKNDIETLMMWKQDMEMLG